MSGARNAILGTLRHALARPGGDEARRAAVEERIVRHARNLVPARGRGTHAQRVALFTEMATEAAATLERVPGHDGVATAVAGFLAVHALPVAVRVAPDPRLDAVPWERCPTLATSRGPARDGDAVAVTGAAAGIAETGTLLFVSGPEHPTTLNFLPDTHIVVLDHRDILAAYEDGWDLLRSRYGNAMPRTVNLVTGPSRTGDIEQTIQLGAHGPRRLHILLVGDGVATD